MEVVYLGGVLRNSKCSHTDSMPPFALRSNSAADVDCWFVFVGCKTSTL